MERKKKRKPAGPGLIYAESAGFCVRELFKEFIGSPHPHLHNDLFHLCDEVETLHRSWVGSKLIEAETGVKVPPHARVLSHLDVQQILARAGTPYPPCAVCGEERITDYCHIFPRMMGGADVPDNIISLCPTHHFHFDSSRLSKEEWDKIDFSGKMPSARAYAEKIVLGNLRRYWEHPPSWWQAEKVARYERWHGRKMAKMEENRAQMRDALSKAAVRKQERQEQEALRIIQALADQKPRPVGQEK